VHRATVQALAADDESHLLSGQAFNYFAFDSRARVLSAEGQKMVRAEALPGNAGLEQEFLRKLIVTERARIEQERPLEIRAISLLQAMSTLWTPPESPEAARATAPTGLLIARPRGSHSATRHSTWWPWPLRVTRHRKRLATLSRAA
jgi:hypothetical protein